MCFQVFKVLGLHGLGVVARRDEQLGQAAQLLLREGQLVQMPRVLVRAPEIRQRLADRGLCEARNRKRKSRRSGLANTVSTEGKGGPVKPG